MKRLITCAAMLCTMCCSAQTYSYDVNGDGEENMEDVTCLINHLLGRVNRNERTYHNGYEYVDLGLPSGLKWAACNVGASSAGKSGSYFAWGETAGYTADTGDGHIFDWSRYSLCEGNYKSLTKYCMSSSYGNADNIAVLEAGDDAAAVNWMGAWRMPTREEFTELRTECTWTWATSGDMNGYLVTGTNGNSIFLPAAGYRYQGSLEGSGSYGHYWSSTLNPDSEDAYGVYFSSSKVLEWSDFRVCGYSVRPVFK